ncbi:hypothetical protein ACE38W_15515 [Chitinophaga sp. Hz27]|uniref:hypothetical protein n=1 Tax=Chitinophaga sp. Hz27 TaxID=3347169 RepID=UPI0035D78A08
MKAMKYAIPAFFSCMLAACGSSGPSEPARTYPYTFLEEKKEIKGFAQKDNTMQLYTSAQPINLDTLKSFCTDKKKNFSGEGGAFHYVVFFDKKENAVFPNNPFTALYGFDEAARHVKAYYEYNEINGYSKLCFFEKNSYQSPVQQFDIK